MHAVYCFLTNAEPLDEFRDCVSSGVFPLDENNWYQEMCAVLKNGDVRLYCSADDWRGRDWLGEKFNALPVEERWRSAVAFAESCVTWEADQAMRMLLGNYQKSSAIALDVAVPVLRATLQRRAKKADAWALSLVARSIAQLENREGPFSRDFTDAYASLRAIALTDKSLEDADIGILFVDIHT